MSDPMLSEPLNADRSFDTFYAEMPLARPTEDWLRPVRAVPGWLLWPLATPVIGLLYMMAGIDLRRRSGWSPNRGDWLLVAVTGFVFQCAMACPIWCLANPGIRFEHPANWWGSIVLWYVASLWMTIMARAFIKYRRRKAGDRPPPPHVRRDIAAIDEKVRVPTEGFLFVALVIAIAETFTLRETSHVWDYHTREAILTFWYVSTVFWAAWLYVTHVLTYLGLTVLYQQSRMLLEFAAEQARRTRAITHIYDPHAVTQWTGIWQGIVREVQHGPVGKSVAVGGSFLTLWQSIVCIWYLAVIRLYRADTTDRDLRSASWIGLFHSLTIFTMYVIVTVRMQRSIEAQHRDIAHVQHTVQQAIDAFSADERDPQDLELLECKVIVLQGLDNLLSVADPNPKFLEMSLDSARWTALNVGLIFVNLFFLQMFIQFCWRVMDDG
jgi:hypothetical protein